MGGQRWKVVGGSDKGGIVVREGKSLDSKEFADRLATGTVVEEENLEGDRLSFRKLVGSGPEAGWVSVRLKDKDLLVRQDAESMDAGLGTGVSTAGSAQGPTSSSAVTASFAGEGRALGSSTSTGAARTPESAQEMRRKALEAAERRQASIPGVSDKKRTERLERQAKEDLLRKLEDYYSRSGDELPPGLRASSTQQLRSHWESLGRGAAPVAGGAQTRGEEAQAPAGPARRGPRAFSAMLAQQAQQRASSGRAVEVKPEEEAEAEAKAEAEGQRAAQRAREEAEARQRRVEEEQRQEAAARREAEEQLRRQEQAAQAKQEQQRKAERLRKTPRSLLICASPGCNFIVHRKPEMGGFCCIACSEGGDHGPRCERKLAPANAVKADSTWSTVGGDHMAEMELQEALEQSILDADPNRGATTQAAATRGAVGNGLLAALDLGGAGRMAPNRGKTQEELDLEEAMRLSMLDALPPDAQDGAAVDVEALQLEEAIRLSTMTSSATAKLAQQDTAPQDEEALQLEEAIRLSMTNSAPTKPATQDAAPVDEEALQLAEDAAPVDEEALQLAEAPPSPPEGSDASEEDDDELPDLVPIQQQ